MRLSLILFLLMLSGVVAQAQNREPSAFNFSTSASVMATTASQNLIVRGWNWGSVHREVSEALNVEFEHGGDITNHKRPNMNLIAVPSGLGGDKNGNYDNQALALQFSPAAQIMDIASTNATGRYTLPPTGDNTGAAFGFLYRTRGTVATIDGVPRFRLQTSDVATTAGTLVLDKPWPDNELRRFNNLNPIGQTNANVPIVKSGDQWYLSINLRPLNPGDGVGDDEVILKIRVPTTVVQTSTSALLSRFMVFETNPDPVVSTYANVHVLLYDNRSTTPTAANFRGRAYYWTPPGGESTTFLITRKMLSRSTHPDSLDMTVSAFIRLDISDQEAANPYYLGEALQESNGYNAIMQTGIEVEYCGKSPVAISWVRFETVYGQEYFRGAHDAEVQNRLEALLNRFKSPSQNPNNCKLFRFYGIDEAIPMQFQAMRYFNKATGGLVMTELGTDYAPHYLSIVQPREYWTGGMSVGGSESSAPYIAFGASDFEPAGTDVHNQRTLLMLGYGTGYIGDKRFSSTVYRNYETRVKDDDIHLETTPLNEYLDKMKSSKAPVAQFVASAMGAYNYSIKKDYDHRLIFSGTPWWAQVWQYGHFSLSRFTSGTEVIDRVARVGTSRLKTGEEIRATAWLPLLLGAKGIMYYQEHTTEISTSANAQYERTGFLGLTSGENATAGLSGMAVVTANTLLGGDFLEYTPSAPLDGNGWVDWSYVKDPSKLDHWMPNLEARAAALGVPTNRIYMGRESARKVVYDMDNWIERTETELASLTLKGWYSKNFKTVITTATISDLNNFNALVLLSENGITTRQIGRTDSKEAWDSTLVHLTYLDSDNNPDNMFYLGVLNARIDPVVIVPTTATFSINGKTVNGTSYGRPTSATLPAIPIGKEMRFFTTAEFDALSTTATPVPSGKLGMYAQLGAREISVKFNYKTTDADYQLLRVQELGGGIDTVVGEDSRLPVLFKPGEGKMFRITPLPVKSKPTGDLAYSNQRKIVAYPKKNSSNELYYHMVYQSTKLGLTSVYYRRSKVVTTGTLSENIEWQAERKLTVTTATGVSHAYPSLVVRNNSAGNPTVYAVYACTGNTIPAGHVLIAESTFDAEAGYSTTGAGVGLYLTKGDVLSEWGTPVISAGAKGNYYAWADKDAGIGIGYKSTSATALSAVSFTSWTTTGTKTCQHPALNTYSRIAWDENEVALVWQEDGNIYYARAYDGTTGSIKLRTIISSDIVRNTATTIARLNDPTCATDNKLPVVYRSIETTYRSPYAYGYFDVLLDRVFWQGTSPRGQKIICARKIDCSDLVSPFSGRRPRQMFFHPLSSIFSTLSTFTYAGELEQPDVSQGNLLWDGLYNRSDSAVTLNCVSYLKPIAEYSIWHIPLNYWTTLVNGSNSLQNLRNSAWMLDRGRRVHLAAKPSFNNIGSWHLNRRIIETASTTSSIVTSAQQFYRSARDVEAITPLPGFSKGCAKYYVLEPYVDQTEVLWKVEEPKVVINSVDTMLWTRFDTLFTNWFTVGSSADISFYGMGSDTSFVQLELVKQSDGSRQTIAVAPATDSTAKLFTRTVINGAGNLYRLELRKKHVDAGFVEDILLGQLPVDNGGGIGPARRGVEDWEHHSIVNLATGDNGKEGPQATVYPNPAGEKVFISVYRNYSSETVHTPVTPSKKLTVTVLNTLGEIIHRDSVLPGSVLELATDALPSGVYLVRVEDVGITGTTYGTTSFVVKR